ncbi:MAG TPA: hypothetical protein VGB38_02420, partial [bacterium]
MKRGCLAVSILLLLIALSPALAVKKGKASLYNGSTVSQRNLLKSARYQWQDGRLIENPQSLSVLADTVRILAILAEFKADLDDKTTGDGRFMLSTEEGETIDPPPHDVSYFQNQLLALTNYYLAVSRGKLVLIPTVFTQSIGLRKEMGYYNPGSTEAELDRGLAELFRDAIQTADSLGAPFSENDAVVVFHAGVGRDVDVGLDITPRDIPSAFLTLGDLQKQLSGNNPSYQGIPVAGGKTFVREGVILPETENQDGYTFGVLGTAALMFGFQLGLPAMWNTQTNSTVIGQWGLMDQGSGNFSGLIPAEPDAFCKIFLGWEDPIEIRQAEQVFVSCPQAKDQRKIYKIPINESEYYLIENRMHDPDGNGLATGWDCNGNRVQFTADGELVSEKPFGVIVRVDEYDFALPGSGILIWHVDETVVKRRLAENAINTDKKRRGVDLEEADGAQDIGEIYGMLERGSGAENGVMQDAWYGDNDAHKTANRSDSVLFSPSTHPSTRSNAGANTHIVVSDFSIIDTVMTFSVRTDWAHDGFPQYFTQGLIPYPPLQGDVDGDGMRELIVATREGKVFAWNPDGSKVMQNSFTGVRVALSGDTVRFPMALFADVGPISLPPILGRGWPSGLRDMLHTTSQDVLKSWVDIDADHDGLADLAQEMPIRPDRPTVLLSGGENGVWIGTDSGSWIHPSGTFETSGGGIRAACWHGAVDQIRLIAATGTGNVYSISGDAGTIEPFASIPLSEGETINHIALGSFGSDRVFIALLTNRRLLTFDTAGTVWGQWTASDTMTAPALG